MNDAQLQQRNNKIQDISEQIVATQKKIRILHSIKWSSAIKAQFFKDNCKKLPEIDIKYYQQRPVGFDIRKTKIAFKNIIQEIEDTFDLDDPIAKIMKARCKEYIKVVDLLKARGTPEFSILSQSLFGSSKDPFYQHEPALIDLADVVKNTIHYIEKHVKSEKDDVILDSEESAKILNKSLKKYFYDDHHRIRVKVSSDIVSDAAAGAEYIKIREDAKLSLRNIKLLEVHEGWVHLGTTLNGMEQPYCTFLSKGTPSTTIIQEGLAVIMEVFSFASHPARMSGLSERVHAIHIAEEGGNFLDVFHFFQKNGYDDHECYMRTMRIFRGSLPTLGPFTKDLVYNKGFILIYNFIRLAIAKNNFHLIPFLFLGKITLQEISLFPQLLEEGTITLPKYIPPPFDDLAGLGAWMCYSLFLNKFRLDKIEEF